MSDEEFDKKWKPNGRPQSTMAKSFSLALDDLFKIDDSIADLDAKVFEKKKVVSTQTSELEALEARLKATEERLKLAGTNPSPSNTNPRSRAPAGEAIPQPPSRKQPTSPRGGNFEQKSGGNTGTSGRSVSRVQRESSFQAPPLPGALPPTPGASEDGDTSPPGHTA